MQPSEIFRYGRDLAANAQDDVAKRTAVNRLYYGSHHEACCRYFRLNKRAQPLVKHGRHQGLYQALNDPLSPRAASVASLLHDLMRLREEADYELNGMRYQGQTLTADSLLQKALKTGEELWRALEAYSPGTAEGNESRIVAYIAS